MDSLDFLHYCLGVGFVVLVGFLSYMFYQSGQILRSVKILIDRFDGIVEDVEDITSSIKTIKDNFKVGSLVMVSNILKYFFSSKEKN